MLFLMLCACIWLPQASVVLAMGGSHPCRKTSECSCPEFPLGENLSEIVFFLDGSDILLAALTAGCEVSDGGFFLPSTVTRCCLVRGGWRWKRTRDAGPPRYDRGLWVSGAAGTPRPAASASLARRDVRRTERSLFQSVTPAVRRCQQHPRAPPPSLRSSRPLGVRRSHAVGGACVGSAGRRVAVLLHAPGRRPHLPSSGHPHPG